MKLSLSLVAVFATLTSNVAFAEECENMKVNMKCKQNKNRLFRSDHAELAGCQQQCAETDGCGFYSYAEEGQFAGVCMGCAQESDAGTHNGFVFYPVSCQAMEDATQEAVVVEEENKQEAVAADYGTCPLMEIHTKCPYRHEDRLYRLEDQTIESCQKKCEETETCAYYSFAAPGAANNYEGVCMGCNSDVAKEKHAGFNLYPVNCLADQAIAGLEGLFDERSFNGEVVAKKGSGSGDPHFKTWSGDKYDYHGECDLVLLDHPSFDNGRGMRIHIRTTRVKYFSYIETIALQIGDDVLEFDNDVENFLMNGNVVEPNKKHHKTMFAGYRIRRDPKAISILLHNEAMNAKGLPKIDFHMRKNGFPAVIVDSGLSSDLFAGSLGLLGQWESGKKMARDGQTEIVLEDPLNGTAMALEWQVRDTEPMLFQETRFPQFPTTCTPPQQAPNRLGLAKATEEAKEACAHWEEDMDDCIFDVIATRSVFVAEEGHIVHIE